MKITIDYLDEQIARTEKNLEFCKEKGFENLCLIYEGELHAYIDIKFHKFMSGHRTWLTKKKIKLKHRLLNWVNNKLRGVEY